MRRAFGVLGHSFVKGLKMTGISVAAVSVAAAGATLSNPEIMVPIWTTAMGVPYASLIVLGLSVLGQTIIDYAKHIKSA